MKKEKPLMSFQDKDLKQLNYTIDNFIQNNYSKTQILDKKLHKAIKSVLFDMLLEMEIK